MLSSDSTSETFDKQPLLRNFQFATKIKVWAIDIFRFILTDNFVKEDPFNTLLLKAHYMFASKLMFALFLYATTFYYAEGPIHCIDRHDRSIPSESFVNYCLSYPYTEIAVHGDKNNIDRHYALHYRWIHMVFFILSLIYLLVKLGIKMLHYQEMSETLENLSKEFIEGFDIAKFYYLNNKGRHGGMYTKFLGVHIISLLINIMAFFGLNIGLQNQYWDLPKHLLTERDPEAFDDAYSLIFPPFTKCEVTVDQYILIDRTKRFGCQLTLMQVYEKIFMLLWIFQIFLMVWNLLFLIVNLPFPYWHKWRVNLLLNYSAYSKYEPFQSFSKKYPVSELFALGRVQNLLHGRDYIKLTQMYDCDEIQDPNETIYYEESDLSKKSPPIGFDRPPSFFQPSSTATPIRSFSPLKIARQNRRPSGSFELPPRHSIGFESLSEANLADNENDATRYFTPLKDQDNTCTFYTPVKETPTETDTIQNFTSSCNEGIPEHTENLIKNNFSTNDASDSKTSNANVKKNNETEQKEENWD